MNGYMKVVGGKSCEQMDSVVKSPPSRSTRSMNIQMLDLAYLLL